MEKAKIQQNLSYLFVFSASVFFAIQLFNFTKRQAVNILFYDQWDFLTPLFGQPSAYEMFTFQHGPHRQGLGLFYSSFIGWLTNWNTRAECFGIFFILVLITIAAFFLKWRLFKKVTVWDFLIAAITFTFMQLESVVLTPNPAHGAIPVLLVVVSAIILTSENLYIRYLLLSFICFFATYTGFGFFLGIIIPIILLMAVLLHWHNKNNLAVKISATALVITIFSTASFFLNYRFNPVQDCFQLPFTDPINYFSFVSLQVSMFFGFHSLQSLVLAEILGFIVFSGWVVLALWQLWNLFREKEVITKSLVVFLLISFSLLFVLNSTSGRVCSGLGAAQSSRYMTLLIPGFLGFYFALQNLVTGKLNYGVNAFLIVILVLIPLFNIKDFTQTMNNFSNVKRGWAKCYVEKESIEGCNKEVGNVVYPAPEATNMQEKLNMLKEKQLNLFAAK